MYKPLLDFFIHMLNNFDTIIEKTFYLKEYEMKEQTKGEIIEHSLKATKKSEDSLTILNEFMELIIFLDQMYKNDPAQAEFFKAFKDPFIFTLAKSYDLKWLKYSYQTKEFFSLKVSRHPLNFGI